MNDNYDWDVLDSRGYANSMGDYKTRREWAFLDRFVPPQSARILDIGGGVGRFAGKLAASGHAVTVSETSTVAISRLLERTPQPLEVVTGDFMTFPDEIEPFDLTLAIESTLYFVEPSLEELFAKVAATTRPGGRFVFTMLNSRSWRPWIRQVARAAPNRYKMATPERISGALDSAGFDVRAMEGFMWVPFSVTSNSRLVPRAAQLEEVLGLSRRIRFAPWLLVAGERR